LLVSEKNNEYYLRLVMRILSKVNEGMKENLSDKNIAQNLKRIIDSEAERNAPKQSHTK
jgi:hypothetical protein